MPNIQLSKLKNQNHEGPVRAKILTFLQKLAEDDTTPGLHIEKMQQQADPKARTGRVDQSLRAVLYRIDRAGEERLYVYAGTWEHDEAIRRAQNLVLQVNPINGIPEFVETVQATVPIFVAPTPTTSPEEAPLSVSSLHPFLEQFGYSLADLTGLLGFDDAAAESLLHSPSEDDLLSLAESFENEWQVNAALALAVGEPIDKIREDLAIGDKPKPGDDAFVAAFEHPASKMQFTFIDNDQELKNIIEGGDFGAWRVFLHPEQRAYAEKSYNGAFRLTGGAGTGKTVVLLHRARNLHHRDHNLRIILTTFTKALSSALTRDLERLDATVSLAGSIGKAGVHVRGIDQLAAEVRDSNPDLFWKSAEVVFGGATEPRTKLVSNESGWREAIEDSDAALGGELQSPTFFETEYLEVVLPARITTLEDYLQVRRPGRGVALERSKRTLVWKVIETYRKASSHLGRMSYAEVSAVAVATLENGPTTSVADSVLVDEAQDLSPIHWQLLRALAPEGENDLFIAEDSHQRIYGRKVVLSRFGIRITGRSRRLTLNYRTTQQNLHFALGVLEGVQYLDSEDSEETTHGYKSSRRGPTPELLASQSEVDQFEQVSALIKTWIDNGVPQQDIAVLCRSNAKRDQLRAQLNDRGISTVVIEPGESASKKPVLMTMYKSKGMEFSKVILFDVSEGSIPNPVALQNTAPEEMDDFLLRERSLLYVAASRARDELVISWQAKPSGLLGSVV
jgi:superfamily I DNA/RNA helicase/antitoxin component HigA of HigAB toxin-antitoxin module